MIEEKTESMEKSKQIVIFRVGEDYISCPISQVREIIQLEEVTPVPSTPETIRGIINRRGEIITIVDLPKVLGIDVELEETESQLIILYQEDENIGVMTSEVTEIPTISDEDVEEPSEALESPVNKKYLEGIVKHEGELVLLTDLLGMLENISREEVKNIDES